MRCAVPFAGRVASDTHRYMVYPAGISLLLWTSVMSIVKTQGRNSTRWWTNLSSNTRRSFRRAPHPTVDVKSGRNMTTHEPEDKGKQHVLPLNDFIIKIWLSSNSKVCFDQAVALLPNVSLRFKKVCHITLHPTIMGTPDQKQRN